MKKVIPLTFIFSLSLMLKTTLAFSLTAEMPDAITSLQALAEQVSSYEPFEIDYGWQIKKMDVITNFNGILETAQQCPGEFQNIQAERVVEETIDFLGYFVDPNPGLYIEPEFVLTQTQLDGYRRDLETVTEGATWYLCKQSRDHYGLSTNLWMTDGQVFLTLYTGEPD